ncbi:MAG: response regulator transcription factor [Chitinophagaceae bacterium]
MIKVAITDDQAIVVNGLQKILSGHDHITLIATYANGEEMELGLEKELPDVLLLDIQMPGKTGIELAGIINKKYPTVKIIALTNIDILIQVKKMLQQGCMGYLLKDTSPDTLILAIETVHGGQQFLYDDLQKQLINNIFDPKSQPVITRREKEILALIVNEYTNQQIADTLFLSLRTVENHRNNLLQKLNVKNTAGLVKIALTEGLI